MPSRGRQKEKLPSCRVSVTGGLEEGAVPGDPTAITSTLLHQDYCLLLPISDLPRSVAMVDSVPVYSAVWVRVAEEQGLAFWGLVPGSAQLLAVVRGEWALPEEHSVFAVPSPSSCSKAWQISKRGYFRQTES